MGKPILTLEIHNKTEKRKSKKRNKETTIFGHVATQIHIQDP